MDLCFGTFVRLQLCQNLAAPTTLLQTIHEVLLLPLVQQEEKKKTALFVLVVKDVTMKKLQGATGQFLSPRSWLLLHERLLVLVGTRS